MYTIDDAWEDAGLWMENWRAAHPDEAREDIDIYLSEDYCPGSPYWPLRDVTGTLIAFSADPKPVCKKGPDALSD